MPKISRQQKEKINANNRAENLTTSMEMFPLRSNVNVKGFDICRILALLFLGMATEQCVRL